MNRRIWPRAALILLVNIAGCAKEPGSSEQNLDASERFIDAFYSFELGRLRKTLEFAESSQASIIYYQGWAEGGNYSVVERHGCDHRDNKIVCPVTVKDDLMAALEIEFDVTDTFHLTVDGGRILSVETSSNDLDVFRDAEAWVWKERPHLVETPCAGYFEGGDTPGDCVRAMLQGFREYTETDEYAAHLSNLELPE
jgi:hypothetical protein